MLERRELLKSSAAFVVAGTLGSLPLNMAAGQTFHVRRNVNTLSPNDAILETYAEGVRKMHELPNSDERSWTRQAQIHQDHCHRQPGHFTTWHRLYINSFEEIIRELTGMNDWALPYWNWSENPQMPAVFFGSDNPLDTSFWNDPNPTTDPNSARQISPNDTISGLADDLAKIENQKLFDVFSSRLDLGPHGAIHLAVGGHMSRYLSPLDPIFWLHHCNVDRIWAKWSNFNNNPNDPGWLSETFENMFVDRNGQFISGVNAEDLLDTEQLGYVYDDKIVAQLASSNLNPQVKIFDEFSNVNVSAINNIPSDLNIPTSVVLPAPDDVRISKDIFDQEAAQKGELDKQVIAKLSDIAVPADAEDYVIRIFLNCPYLSPEVPTTDPHFVAEINLFSLRMMSDMANHNMNPSALLDLTETMVNLNLRRTPVLNNIEVQLISVGSSDGDPAGTEFKVGRVDLFSV